MIKNICKSVIISYLVSFALLLIGAIVMFYCHVTEKTVSALVIIIYFISNLIGGINAGRLAQSRKFVKGIMVGIIYFCVLFLIWLIGNEKGCVINSSILICAIVSIFGGMIGGMIS